MTRISLAVLVAVVLWALVMGTPVANASPLCEYRSSVHVSEHGGLAADSAWHVAHGDLPTCDSQQSEPRHTEDQDGDNDRFCIGRCNDKWWRND